MLLDESLQLKDAVSEDGRPFQAAGEVSAIGDLLGDKQLFRPKRVPVSWPRVSGARVPLIIISSSAS